MSSTRRLAAILAALTALVALPATASAHSTASGTSVNAHVTKAAKAVDRLERAVKRGNTASAARQLRIARSQTARASVDARMMARVADTPGESAGAAASLTIAGAQYDALLESITALVDQIRGRVQTLIAQAIPPSIEGRQRIIAVLTSLMDRVPAHAQPILASIIAALSAGDSVEVTNLESALESGNLPSSVSAIVTQALNMATQAIATAFATVQSILPMLPEFVRGPISAVLGLVQSTVGTIVPSVLSTVTGLLDSILGALPIFGGTPAAGTGDSGGGGSLLSGLFGGLFGGDSSSGIGGLLSSVFGMISRLLGGALAT